MGARARFRSRWRSSRAHENYTAPFAFRQRPLITKNLTIPPLGSRVTVVCLLNRRRKFDLIDYLLICNVPVAFRCFTAGRTAARPPPRADPSSRVFLRPGPFFDCYDPSVAVRRFADQFSGPLTKLRESLEGATLGGNDFPVSYLQGL